jgi:hypothetical protein
MLRWIIVWPGLAALVCGFSTRSRRRRRVRRQRFVAVRGAVLDQQLVARRCAVGGDEQRVKVDSLTGAASD